MNFLQKKVFIQASVNAIVILEGKDLVGEIISRKLLWFRNSIIELFEFLLQFCGCLEGLLIF
jgi:hypothetical protein